MRQLNEAKSRAAAEARLMKTEIETIRMEIVRSPEFEKETNDNCKSVNIQTECTSLVCRKHMFGSVAIHKIKTDAESKFINYTNAQKMKELYLMRSLTEHKKQISELKVAIKKNKTNE